MGQQKNTQLKAYVRFDGTGRIVPSSLILQRSKPKVGNWQEIDATECCGYVPSTTTTTSSSTSTTTSTSTSTTTTSTSTSTTTSTSTSTTTTTTTAAPVSSFQVNFAGRVDAPTACTSYVGGPITTMYSNVSTLVPGSILYNDSALTDPWSGGGTEYWFAVDNNGTISSMQVGRIADANTGIILSITPCV